MREQTRDKLSYLLIGTISVATPCLVIPTVEAIAAPPENVSDFKYVIENEQVMITGYEGETDTIVVPGEIEGYPVTNLAGNVFQGVTLQTLDLTQTQIESVEGHFNNSKIDNLLLPSTIKKVVAFVDFTTNSLDLSQLKITDTTGTMNFIRVNADNIILPASLEGTSNVQIIQCNINLVDYSLTSIEEFLGYAFFQSTGGVRFPSSTRLIGEYSLGMSNLTSINLENTQITKIGQSAFFKSKIPSIQFPLTIQEIENNAFWGAEFSTDTLDLSNNTNLIRIGESSFAFINELKFVLFPESLKEIETRGFEFTPLESIVLPSTLETLGEMAFGFSKTLQSVDLSKTVLKVIPNGAFSGQPITSLAFPSTLEEIHSGAFGGNRVPVIDLSNTNLHYLAGRSFSWSDNMEYIKAFILPPTLKTYNINEGEALGNPYAAYYGLNNGEFYNALVTFYGERLEEEGNPLAYNQFLILSSDTIDSESQVHEVSVNGYPYIPLQTQHFYSISKEKEPSSEIVWNTLPTIPSNIEIKSVEGGEFYIHTNSVWAGEDHYNTLGPFIVLPSLESEPEPEQPQPEQPQPEQPQPEPEQPQPEPEQPQPEPEQPQPEPEQPQPKPEQPQPKPEQPQPEPEQPQPKPEQPQPEPEQPQPEPEQPQPKPEQSQPEPENACKRVNAISPLEVMLAEEKSGNFIEADAFELKIKLNNVIPRFNIQEVFTLEPCEASLSDGSEKYTVGTSILKDHNRIVRIKDDGKAYTVPHFLDGEKLVVTTKNFKGLYLTSQSAIPFKDIVEWHNEEDINSLYNYLIIHGTTATTFSPNGNTSRAQFSAMIARALELIEEKSTYAFKDGADSWYADYAQSLYEVGIVEGFTDGTFRGNQPITRQQASAMIVRMLEYIGVDTSVNEQFIFADESSIYDYAKPAVQYLAAQGILVNGKQTKFNPNTPITRNQLAKVLMRALRLSDWY